MIRLGAWPILTVLVASAVSGGGCGSSNQDVTLASLRDRTLGVIVGEANEIDVLIGYAGSLVGGEGVCATIGAGLHGTFNGRPVEVAERNQGPSIGPCKTGYCVRCQADLRVGGAASLATPDGSVEAIVADESQTLGLAATGALLPSLISLPATQSDHVRGSDVIMVMTELASREPPLTMIDLVLQQRTTGGISEVEVAQSQAGGGVLRVGFPVSFSGPAVLAAKSRSWLSSPKVSRCDGAVDCGVPGTNIVGDIPLVIQ
jgi:hypothetical protein